MREPKYQAWHQYAEQMFLVIGLKWDAKVFRKFSEMTLISLDDAHTIHTVTGGVCDNFILREFTGLWDKSGKEIYEGDVVSLTYARHNKHETHEVYWDGEKACYGPFHHFTDRYCEDRWIDVDYEVEVVGTIWEHPELVKNKNKP